jgi:endonuclease/exonuclease/phosphatase (EEP) superfamily protein YafD
MSEPDSVLRRSIRPLVRAGCWLVIAGAVAWLGFGHFWRHDPADTGRLDGWLAFAALCGQAFRFHLGFAIAAALVVALVVRARWAAVLLVLLLIPTLGARAAMYGPWRGPAADADAPGITVFSANLLLGRGDAGAVLDQIGAADPDVILFQEYTPASAGYEAALRAAYPHALVWPREDAFGQAVFSRLPFAREPELWRGPVGSVIPLIACEVLADGRRVAVWNVHTLPPVGSRNTIEQRRMVAWIATRATRALGGADPPDGLVIAGDFNAPFGTNHLRELVEAGLGEAHAAVGTDAGSTWPRLWWKRHLPGIRLDHVVFGGGLAPVWSAVGDDFGSDHRPVSARFVFE